MNRFTGLKEQCPGGTERDYADDYAGTAENGYGRKRKVNEVVYEPTQTLFKRAS